jgi:hypothetical protein
MIEIKKLVIKASINEQSNQEANNKNEEIQKLYEHIDEVKQEILHDVDVRIVEILKNRIRK